MKENTTNPDVRYLSDVFEFNDNTAPAPNRAYKHHRGYLLLRSRPMCQTSYPAHFGQKIKDEYVPSDQREGFDESLVEVIPTKRPRLVLPARLHGPME